MKRTISKTAFLHQSDERDAQTNPSENDKEDFKRQKLDSVVQGKQNIPKEGVKETEQQDIIQMSRESQITRLEIECKLYRFMIENICKA